MECSEIYYGGPKYKAGYTPISEDLCYAFLLEGNLDRSYVGEHANGALLKEHGQGYGGIWGEVRDSLADDAVVNYQWIEAICVESPWFRGRTIIIGDAAHACPPLIAQGAAMCAEDAVVLAEMLDVGRRGRRGAAGVHGRAASRASRWCSTTASSSPSGRSTRRPPAPTPAGSWARPCTRCASRHDGCRRRPGRARRRRSCCAARPASRRPGSTGSSTGA